MPFPRPHVRVVAAALVALAAMGSSRAESIDFSRQILPILSDACFRCHGPDAAARKAKLRLDQREGLYRTREDITVVVPGKPEQSELIQRITSQHEDEVMPPPEATRRLKPAEIDLLRRWVAAGAPWGTHWAFAKPVKPPVPGGAGSPNRSSQAEKTRQHQRLTNAARGTENRPEFQAANRASTQAGSESRPHPANPIDAFVRQKLAAAGLTPSPEAPRETLLRRVTLDLTGLPPTPAEVDAFLADDSPGAYERVVDRLLASPRYGERWAWEWLDLARYADTNGFQGDPERTMWPWRDWVVKALNANMPYDEFTIEQLAGDLLPNATTDQKLASGFHRNNMFNGEGGRIPEETRVENVFDRVETTATVWLGLTFTCARCHDHKFDPIKQTDYYALYDIFNQMSETGKNSGGQVPPLLDLSTPAERAAQKKAVAQHDAVAKEVEAYERTKFPRPDGKPLSESPDALALPGNLPATLAKTEPKRRGVDSLLEAVPYFREADPAYADVLQKLLDAVRARDAANARITRVMIMDQLAEPRETFVLERGNYEKKTAVQVCGAIPSLFRAIDVGGVPSPRDLPARETSSVRGEGTPPTGADDTHGPARLNRLDLARWLVSSENPLAARVAVNRAWQAFFGVGLVKTPEDFGVQGERPSHPELLDWLATEFVESGWDVKALHRRIVTSATYRQSSRAAAEARERDPENRLLARGPRHRLPSWMLRDQALAAAGLLVEKQGGPAVKPYQPAGIWEEATFGKKTYQQDHGAALYRRSLYVFWRRIVGPTSFFDAGARQICTVKVARTNTPLHALVTLNDPAFVEPARVLAQGVIAHAEEDPARLAYAFRILMARQPSAKERSVLLSRLEKLRVEFAADSTAALQFASVGEAPRPESIDPVDHAAWTGLCSLLMNLDEVLSKE